MSPPAVESSLPLRGIETASWQRSTRANLSPHCPYEGLKQLDVHREVDAREWSSLPLRGIETPVLDRVVDRRRGRPHCPYEGLKLWTWYDSPLVIPAGPHCPYEGLKLRHDLASLQGVARPHYPYEGLKRRFALPVLPAVRVLIAPTRD